MHGANRLQQLIVQDVLRQVRQHARDQRAADVFVTAVSGERNHPGGGELRPDRGGRLHSSHPRHAQVQQGHIRAVLAEQLHGLQPVGGLRHNRHIGLHVDNRAHPHPGHQVVFGNQNSNFIDHGNGTFTSTSVPPSGRLARRSSPPSRSARSRIPISPKWPPCEENTSCCSKPRPLSTIRRKSRRASMCSLTQILLAAACFRTLVTASCAMRSNCCSASSVRGVRGPVTSTSTSTPDPAVHSRVLDSSAAARSCPSRTEARKSITERRASVRLCRAILRAISKYLRTGAVSSGRHMATASSCEEMPTNPCASVS